MTQDDWQRVVGFVKLFVPKHDFQLPALDIDAWKSSVAKFKPKAARGLDGFSKEDLQWMPNSFMQPLIDMMNCLEAGRCDWPQQLLCGAVIGLAKHNGAYAAGHFRPITLFSMIFRAWSKLRTKQLIRQMATCMPTEALGFLPDREAPQIWLQLQGTIELMLQHRKPLCGLSTDLQKAFNHIGRDQVWMLASQVGLPNNLLRPWKAFLTNFERRFDINGCFGEAIRSNSGYPEGDPLSIVAMLLVDWCYHIYTTQYAPRVQNYSFVDNLTLVATSAAPVLQAFFALKTIMQLFGLSTDDDKTFVWGLDRQTRDGLATLGFPCVQDANELRGSMTYGAAVRNRLLKQRGRRLQAKWDRLRRSQAPLPQKVSVLPKIFWPAAMHGISACLVADTYAMELRRAAVKALRISGAGSNPQLRLSLQDDMLADPGFYQIQTGILQFRRMLAKCPDLIFMWKIWHAHYDGKLHPGPFSQLQHSFESLGWGIVEPPFVMNHEQHCHNLQQIDRRALLGLLQDGWLQNVAAKVNHDTMKDFNGLDPYLTLHNAARLQPIDRARLSALQSGAFVTALEHSRYDDEKCAICIHCRLPDDRTHWLTCPRFANLRDSIPNWSVDNLELPLCTLHHLLVPRQVQMVDWRETLFQIPDATFSFSLKPPTKRAQHVFTDGSCIGHRHPILQLASWGVVSATEKDCIASGHLSGLTQSIDRAELTAAICALRWGFHFSLDLYLWLDSLSTVQMGIFVQTNGYVPATWANQDLWHIVSDLLQDRISLLTCWRWIPSHLPSDVAVDTFEDWAIHWNDEADKVALTTNETRPRPFWIQFGKLERLLDWWVDRLTQLRTFYFQVAADGTARNSVETTLPDPASFVDDDEPDFQPVELTYEDRIEMLPINWKHSCMTADGTIPGAFLVQLVDWICAMETLGDTVRTVSVLELLCICVQDSQFRFPILTSGNTQWEMRNIADLFARPTVASLLRPLYLALRCLSDLFPEGMFQIPAQAWPDLGLYMKFQGLKLRMPTELAKEARTKLLGFTSRRPVRRTCDLARPLT